MTAYERMAVALDATGLYHLEKAPRMSAEMQAYGVVLDQIYEDLRECLYGAFLDEIDNPYSGYHARTSKSAGKLRNDGVLYRTSGGKDRGRCRDGGFESFGDRRRKRNGH